jgi:hypothetical protein
VRPPFDDVTEAPQTTDSSREVLVRALARDGGGNPPAVPRSTVSPSCMARTLAPRGDLAASCIMPTVFRIGYGSSDALLAHTDRAKWYERFPRILELAMHRISFAVFSFLSIPALFSTVACSEKIVEAPPDEGSGESDDDGTATDDEDDTGSDELGGKSGGKGGSSKGKGGATGKGGADSKGGSTGKGGATGKGGSSAKGGSSGTGGSSKTTTSSCSKSGAWATSDQYGGAPFDNYVLRNNAWNLAAAGAGTQTI